MMRALGLAATLCAVLVAADALLALRSKHTARADPVVERFVDPSESTGKTVAALTLAKAGGDTFFFVRSKGLWRSVEANGAIVERAHMEALLGSLLQARGVVRTTDPARADAYGFADPLHVVLHGPKVMSDAGRDVLFSFELGTPRFARRAGDARILELDRDPRELWAGDGSPLAYLLDRTLIAGSTEDGFHGFRSFEFEFAAGGSFRLESQSNAVEDTPWIAAVPGSLGGARREVPAYRIGGYIGLLLRESFLETEPPSRAADLGLVPPAVRITMTPNVGPPIVIEGAPSTRPNRAYLWNKNTNVLMVVSSDVYALAAPDLLMLADADRPNPWESYLGR
ncbi:MAG: hypothetical protein ACKVWV_04350 [Planctomycetota bacterium]